MQGSRLLMSMVPGFQQQRVTSTQARQASLSSVVRPPWPSGFSCGCAMQPLAGDALGLRAVLPLHRLEEARRDVTQPHNNSARADQQMKTSTMASP